MSEGLSDLDAAWEQVVATRARGDASREARALSLLELALYQEGRGEEADEIGRQVVDLAGGCTGEREILLSRLESWMRLGARLEEEADVSCPPGDNPLYKAILDLGAARGAYCRALAALDVVAGANEPMREEVRQRAEAVDRRLALRREELPRNDHISGDPFDPEWVETVFVGFLAVKILGPFLEEWARKLGEQFGESTVRALSRIKFKRPRRTKAIDDEVSASGHKAVACWA